MVPLKIMTHRNIQGYSINDCRAHKNEKKNYVQNCIRTVTFLNLGAASGSTVRQNGRKLWDTGREMLLFVVEKSRGGATL
jgi:hypothetical protein